MGPRSRSLRIALSAAMLIALTALPGVWFIQTPGNVIGPATAWAGGTPDETLNPPPTPPKKSSSADVLWDSGTPISESAITYRAERIRISRIDRIKAIWKFLRATTLRM